MEPRFARPSPGALAGLPPLTTLLVANGWSGVIEPVFDTGGMSTKDQLLSGRSPRHGDAIRRRAQPAEAIAELREIANGRDDILAEAAVESRQGLGMPGCQLTLAMSWSPAGC